MRICVFCGSSPGVRPAYLAAACELGEVLAARGIGLVYGGASVGLMGELADAVLAGGGEAIGVIPGRLVDCELAHGRLTELHVVETMHERKALMAELSDAFVVLPGGAGTLDEFFEALTWRQLGLHSKPLALLDVGGFFEPLLRLADHLVAEGFVLAEFRALLLVERDPATLLERLAAS
jgi:uncharacterized protein (TIGR00730 family)